MYLCLVIKEAYSLSFFTSSTLACTAWLDVKYSSRQQFVRFTASWRRSFLQHNTLRLPHLNIIREKFFNIRKTISLKTFIYVFQYVYVSLNEIYKTIAEYFHLETHSSESLGEPGKALELA